MDDGAIGQSIAERFDKHSIADDQRVVHVPAVMVTVPRVVFRPNLPSVTGGVGVHVIPRGGVAED